MTPPAYPMSSKANDKCPYKRQKRRTHRGEGPKKMETEIGGVQPPVWEHLRPPEAGRDKAVPPLEPSEGCVLANTLILDFQLPELWDNTFLGGCFSPPVCGAYSSLRKSKQLDTRGRT